MRAVIETRGVPTL